MLINRKWCMPNKWTFTMKPVKELLQKYVPENGSIQFVPFSGYNSCAEITNDIDPNAPTLFHERAIDFVSTLHDNIYDGALFDPPYSPTQLKQCYDNIGVKMISKETTSKFYWDVKKEVAKKLKVGGIAISFGWNSTGFGTKLGFEKIEILLLYHGSNHNDTIIVVERKL
jgi:hypothetical protein